MGKMVARWVSGKLRCISVGDNIVVAVSEGWIMCISVWDNLLSMCSSCIIAKEDNERVHVSKTAHM